MRFITIAVVATIFVIYMNKSEGQMVKVTDLPEFKKIFKLEVNQRKPIFNIRCIKSNIPGNILYSSENAKFSFQLINNTPNKIDILANIEIIPYASRGRGGDIWHPVLFCNGKSQSTLIKIQLAPNGFQNITLLPKIPEKFGAYALVIDLGKYGRKFMLSCSRALKPKSSKVAFPKSSLDGPPRLSVATLKRLGIRAVRYEFGYIPTTAANFTKWFADTCNTLEKLHNANITVMMMVGATGNFESMPLGRPRPHLDAQATMLNSKSDMAWLPKYDKDFQKFCYMLMAKKGWPNGPITAFCLWNEPWEGISISGWGADMIRYKTIYRHMAAAVLEARKKKGVKVLIGGTDSTSNALDKLFSDPTEDFLPIFDFSSVHYQGLFTGNIINSWADRKGDNGRVKLWDTESWVANSDERIAAVTATLRAAGLDRTMGVYTGYISTSATPRATNYDLRLADGKKKRISAPPNAWSVAAPVAAANRFIGDRDFSYLLYPDGLPWIFVFKGKDGNKEDGTVVVVGDIRAMFGHNNVTLRNALTNKQAQSIKAEKKFTKAEKKLNSAIFNNDDAHMVLPAKDTRFNVYDCYGNKIQSVNGNYLIPLCDSSYFIRGDGSNGAFNTLLTTLRKSRIEGLSPLIISARDFTSAIKNKPTLEINLKNIINHPVEGVLNVQVGSLQLKKSQYKVSIGKSKSKTLTIKIAGGHKRPDNTYPLKAVFTSSRGETAVLYEKMHVNIIAHQKINIDGDLKDWRNIPGYSVKARGTTAPSLTEKAWRPFEKYSKELRNGFAQGYFAYDKDYFYFAARVADNSIDKGMPSFAKVDEDQYFYPEEAYEIDKQKSFSSRLVKRVKSQNKNALIDSEGQGRHFAYWESADAGNALAVDVPEIKAPCQVAIYLPPWKIAGNGEFVEVINLKNGRVIDKRFLRPSRRGIYFVCNISVPVRFRVVSNGWWYSAKIGGVFIDPVRDKFIKHELYKYVRQDDDTLGNWKNKYGQLGYLIAGEKSQRIAKCPIKLPDHTIKICRKWPNGVRKFSYRKCPILPFGHGFDNVQLAFNVLPREKKCWNRKISGIPYGFSGTRDTDYEFALNPLSSKYGGGTEIFKLLSPNSQFIHFYPREYKSPLLGVVKKGKLIVKHNANTRIIEAAIPWSEIPEVKACMLKKNTYKVNI